MGLGKKKISNVPTNIITGFLGVGKTSAILHLLHNKPTNQRWSVLVNEFGEIGVDGSLFAGQHEEGKGVFVREVPGGCMCCTAGLPMRVALNVLLRRSRPDRLLIEPTGLGHPTEVLQVLSGEHYQGVLSIQKILTLVDARKLADSRYTEHETFNQQIAIADIVVGNKRDLYGEGDETALKDYVRAKASRHVQVLMTEQGVLDPSWLEGPTAATVDSQPHHHHHEEQKRSLNDLPIPESGYVKAMNQGDGFFSVGWRFAAVQLFAREKLVLFLQKLQVERMKGVFLTKEGVFGYNLTLDGLTELQLAAAFESRIEIIAKQIDDGWEKELHACVLTEDGGRFA